LTGETQLRARRTRIKILKAIADKNGVAGFSDIKLSTGLSTGSIYYHLERMGNYVTKNSKYYVITEEGLQHLREVDPKYAAGAAPLKRTEEQVQPEGSGTSEETISRPATIVASFLMIRYSYPAFRYRGMMLSVSALTVLLAGLFVFSGVQFTGASPVQPYDNSMDALLSSYSLHWQIR
jgi:hypothetical protein